MGKTVLKQQAYEIIKEKILSCEYPPDTVLSEEQLRETVGASRTPVRDALSRLEQEELVRILPKKGILVVPVSVHQINMIYETRFLLEPYAVRTYGRQVPKEWYEEINCFLCEENLQLQSCESLYEFDRRFHQQLIEASSNTYLINMYDRIYAQIRRLRILSGERSPRRLKETGTEHRKIAQACLAGDWDGAATAMEEHLRGSRQAALEAVQESSIGI